MTMIEPEIPWRAGRDIASRGLISSMGPGGGTPDAVSSSQWLDRFARPSAQGVPQAVSSADWLARRGVAGPPSPAGVASSAGNDLVQQSLRARVGERVGSAAPSALRSGGWARAATGWKGGLGGSVATIAGNLLDESELLGGRDSGWNNTASKALKWGGTGAAIGSVVPGVGTGLGAVIGTGVGLGHSALEGLGILGEDENARLRDTKSEAGRIMSEMRFPVSARNELERQFNGLLALAGDDQGQREEAMNAYLDKVREAAAYVIEGGPEALMSEEEMYQRQIDAMPNGGIIDMGPPQTPEQMQMVDMTVQKILGEQMQPYALEYLQRADAAADMMDQAAAGSGSVEPFYRVMAQQYRANAPRNVMNTMQAATEAPYIQALHNQTMMLKQQAQNMQQQAMSAVSGGDWQAFQDWRAQQSGGGGGFDLASFMQNQG